MGAYFKIFCCILTVIILASCNEKKDKNNSMPVVDIEDNINNMEILNLNQFTDNIKYVKPEKTEGMEFKVGFRYDFCDHLILISDYHVWLLYDSNGKFISKIGKGGRGSGK